MSTQYVPEQSLGFILNDVARLLRRTFNRRIQDMGLTQTQWQALVHIAIRQGLRQSQLADILEVQPISVARLIDRMEASGWVERRPDCSDRRAVNLYLTDKVEPILADLKEHAAAVRAEALRGISKEEQEMMMRNLLLMRQNLTKDDN